MPRSLPPSRKVKISFGCLRPEAHSLQFLRVQGERVSVSEPFATGHRAASFSAKASFAGIPNQFFRAEIPLLNTVDSVNKAD